MLHTNSNTIITPSLIYWLNWTEWIGDGSVCDMIRALSIFELFWVYWEICIWVISESTSVSFFMSVDCLRKMYRLFENNVWKYSLMVEVALSSTCSGEQWKRPFHCSFNKLMKLKAFEKFRLFAFKLKNQTVKLRRCWLNNPSLPSLERN